MANGISITPPKVYTESDQDRYDELTKRLTAVEELRDRLWGGSSADNPAVQMLGNLLPPIGLTNSILRGAVKREDLKPLYIPFYGYQRDKDTPDWLKDVYLPTGQKYAETMIAEFSREQAALVELSNKQSLYDFGFMSVQAASAAGTPFQSVDELFAKLNRDVEDAAKYYPEGEDLEWWNNTIKEYSKGKTYTEQELYDMLDDPVIKELLENANDLSVPMMLVTEANTKRIAEALRGMYGDFPAEVPEGYTEESALAAIDEWLPKEDVSGVMVEFGGEEVTLDDALAAVGKQLFEQQTTLSQIKEMPNPTVWQYLLQPMLKPLEILNLYNKYVSQPIAGSVVRLVSLLNADQKEEMKFLKTYNEIREQDGVSYWSAASTAFEQWEYPWIGKLLIEMLVDPLSYAGVGLAPKIFGKFGKVGAAIGRIDTLVWRDIANIPFDEALKLIAKIPKLPGMKAVAEGRIAQTAFARTLNLETGEAYANLSMDKVQEVMFKVLKEGGQETASPDMRTLYRYIANVEPIDEADIVTLCKKIDGFYQRKDAITRYDLEGIQTRLDDIVLRGTKDGNEAIDNFLKELRADINDKNITAVENFIKKRSTVSEDFIKSMKNDANPLIASGRVRDKVIADYKRYYASPSKFNVATAGSKIGQVRMERAAIAEVTFNKLDTFLQKTVRNAFYQVLVTAPAKLYLGFPGYYMGNVLENMFRSLVGGSNPSRKSAEYMAQKFARFYGSPVDFLGEAAQQSLGAGWAEIAALGREGIDWASMTGMQRFRAAFSRETLLGNEWIRLSARHGALIRNGYMDSRFMMHLAENISEHPVLEDFANKSYQYIDSLILNKKIKSKLKAEFAEAIASEDPVAAVARIADALQESELKKSALRAIVNEDSGNIVSTSFLHSHIDNGTLFTADLDKVFEQCLEIDRVFRLFDSEEIGAAFETIKTELGKVTIKNTTEYHQLMQRLRILTRQYEDFQRPIFREAYKAASMLKRNSQKDALWSRVFESLDKATQSAESTLDDIYDLMRQNAQTVFKRQSDITSQVAYIDDYALKHLNYKTKSDELRRFRTDFFQGRSKPSMTNEDWLEFYNGLDDIQRKYVPYEIEARASEEFNTLQSFSKFKPRAAKDFSGQDILSADDLGYILGTHPNPLTNAILNNAYLQDEDMFVGTILGYARAGKHTVSEEQIRKGYRALWGQAQIRDKQLMNEMGLVAKNLAAKKQAIQRLKAAQIVTPKQKQQIDGAMGKLSRDMETLFGNTELTVNQRWFAKHSAMSEILQEADPNNPTVVQYLEDVAKYRRARSDKGRTAALTQLDLDEDIMKNFGVLSDAQIKQAESLASARTQGLTRQQLLDLQQDAFNKATKDFYRNFPSYDNDNALNALMRTIYPYWNYEWQRPLWVGRTFATKPVVPLTWSRYTNYTDRGYIRVGDLDMEFNPFRGTIFMGGFFGLLYDYPEYETDHPGLANLWDFQQRMGFYPNFLIQALYTGMTMKEGEEGRLIPAPIQSILDLIGGVPALGDTVNQQRLRHGGAYLDYGVTNLATKKCQEQGKMFTGIDIWNAIEEEYIHPFGKDETLETTAMGDTPQANNARKLLEMKQIWEDAQRAYSLLDFSATQAGIMRIYPKEREVYMQELMDLQKKLSGLSEREIKEMWRNGYSLSQAMGRGYTPEERELMERLEGQYYWAGITQSVRPYDQQVYQRTSREYYATVAEQRKRYAIDITKLDKQMLAGELSFDTWAAEVESIEEKAYNVYDVVKESNPEYAAIPSNLTERVQQWEALGLPQHGELPQPAAQYLLSDLYFSLEPQWQKYVTDDGEVRSRRNWEQYFAAMDYIDDIAEEWGIGAEWQELIESQYSSPLQALRRDVNEKYITRYWQIDGIVMEVYYTPSERDYLELIQRGDVDKPAPDTPERELWNSYQSRLKDARKSYRQMFPEADYWLRFFGITQTSATKTAEHLWEVRGRDLSKIADYQHYTTMYPKFVAEDANKGFDWDL